jgi:hypothetical protein
VPFGYFELGNIIPFCLILRKPPFLIIFPLPQILDDELCILKKEIAICWRIELQMNGLKGSAQKNHVLIVLLIIL